MVDVVFYGILYGIPSVVALFFVVSLCRYCIAKIRNKKEPGRYSEHQVKIRKILLIVSTVSLISFVVVIGGITWIFVSALSHM